MQAEPSDLLGGGGGELTLEVHEQVVRPNRQMIPYTESKATAK